MELAVAWSAGVGYRTELSALRLVSALPLLQKGTATRQYLTARKLCQTHHMLLADHKSYVSALHSALSFCRDSTLGSFAFLAAVSAPRRCPTQEMHPQSQQRSCNLQPADVPGVSHHNPCSSFTKRLLSGHLRESKITGLPLRGETFSAAADSSLACPSSPRLH